MTRVGSLVVFFTVTHDMISILRTLPTTRSLLPRASSSITKFMDSSSNASSIGGSQRLFALAQHLRQYKAPSFPEDIVEQSIEEIGGKVVSQVGFQESAIPIGQNPEKFRPKKAAVLICLFEGDDGDLRVILTKRSSKLSTHSGLSKMSSIFCLFMVVKNVFFFQNDCNLGYGN